MRIVGQLLVFAAFAALIGFLSAYPSYRRLPEDRALVRLSFSHAGATKGECRRFTPEEIAEMAPNMRRAMDCPRERVPVVVELDMDGKRLWSESLVPAGLARDGSSTVYRRFEVPAGAHRIAARLRDSNRSAGFDHEAATEVNLPPGGSFVIDFHAAAGGFEFFGGTGETP
jgi:hypothetical protein